MSGDLTGEDNIVAAANAEVAARDVNEVRAPTPEAGWDLTLVSYTCECGDIECEDEVRLTVEEYEGVREDPSRFFVVPGHVFAEAERVVEVHGRYEVVEKLAVAAAIAQDADPRA